MHPKDQLLREEYNVVRQLPPERVTRARSSHAHLPHALNCLLKALPGFELEAELLTFSWTCIFPEA